MVSEIIRSYFLQQRDQIVSDLSRLVRIDSALGKAQEGMPFGPGAAQVLAEALEIAKGYGFAVQNYDNYVGAVDFNGAEKGLDILAHLDVVPPGEGWRVTAPFEPLVVDGRIYGRGTADDKGPCVVALHAMRALRESGIQLKKNVRLLLGTDEECGSSDIAYYYQKEPYAPYTVSPDGAFPVVNLEKGGFRGSITAEFLPDERLPRIVSAEGGVKFNVVPAQAMALVEGLSIPELQALAQACQQRTGVTFEFSMAQGESDRAVAVTANGVGGHAAYPVKASNAITGLLDFLAVLPCAPSDGFQKLQALSAIFPHGDWLGEAAGVAMADEKAGPLTISLTIFKFTLENLRGFFDSRTPLAATPENTAAVMEARLAQGGLKLEAKISPPHYIPDDSPFVQTLLRCYEQFTGKAGRCLSMGGGTYVHHVENGLCFGMSFPGDSDHNIHGADEFAVIDDLLTAGMIYAQTILEICGAE